MPTFEFYDEADHALQKPLIVLRDSLGPLAVQLLTSRYDITKMSNHDLLEKLHQIVSELHTEYSDYRTRTSDI